HSYTLFFYSIFFFNDPSTTEIYTLSLHDALPILRFRHSCSVSSPSLSNSRGVAIAWSYSVCVSRSRLSMMPRTRSILSLVHLVRSEEHTSELQSRGHLVCRLLLEKKKKKKI